MASNKFIKLVVKLQNGSDAALYLGLGNFTVTQSLGEVTIEDGVADGGRQLHPSEQYEEVIRRIDQLMRESELFPRPTPRGIKD